MTDAYTIGRSSPDRIDNIAVLHNRVFGTWGEHAGEQLAWKYVENPLFDRFPVVTARDGEQVVGMLGMVPQRLRVSGESVLGFQAADAAVHPDHRRQGIFSALFEAFRSFARTTEAELLTGFTNEAATRGLLQHGWTRMSVGRYVYVDPSIAAPESLLSPVALARTGLSVAHAGLVSTVPEAIAALRRRRTGDGLTVERFDSPPVDVLASLYETNAPERAHAERSARFYTWRLAEPLTDFATYVAFDGDGKPSCGIVVSESDGTVLYRDAVPLAGGRPGHLFVLVDRVLREYDEATRFAALDGFPHSRALLKRGFVPPSLDALRSSTRTFITLPLGDGDTVRGLDITARENWSLLHVERDF